MHVLSMNNGSVVALNRTASNSTLASPGLPITGATSTMSTASVHVFRFPSAALAKLFWQYAVACHAFFRIREPSSGGGGVGFRGSVAGSTMTSISATAFYAAIQRATGGFRRYFSLARRDSTVTASLSGPVGGIGRTLSTVMELRRNSRVFDRGFSRENESVGNLNTISLANSRIIHTPRHLTCSPTYHVIQDEDRKEAVASSRRSNRRSLVSSNTNVTFAPSAGMRSSSNNSLIETPVGVSNAVPVKTYTQMPPPGARASYAGKHWGSRQSETTAATSRYSSMSAVGPRQSKRPAPGTNSSMSASYQHPQQESYPLGSRGSSTPADKSTRTRGSKSGSPTAPGPSSRTSQRRGPPASPSRSHANATSPKSLRRTPEPRNTDRFRQSPGQFNDDENDLNGLNHSEPSDSDLTLNGGDFDETEAAGYWHQRRAQAVRGTGRTPSSNRMRTNSGSSRPDISAKRRLAPEPFLGSSELPPGTEMVYKAGFSRTGSSAIHRVPLTGSTKTVDKLDSHREGGGGCGGDGDGGGCGGDGGGAGGAGGCGCGDGGGGCGDGGDGCGGDGGGGDGCGDGGYGGGGCGGGGGGGGGIQNTRSDTC
ncbi:unnamed protein product [Echinostoma caproni]|uniref:Protein kinase domain-containing protein n=1 Tax=Echinostoma caproni TaxID=27848 RepID=A0A183AC89_9TREM|nr:unnamed protein product [Echinostoma caproni]